jgi:hypothetical protein
LNGTRLRALSSLNMHSPLQTAPSEKCTTCRTSPIQEKHAMPTSIKLIPAFMLVLGCYAPQTFAQSAPSATEGLYSEALAAFREARFPAAYARFIRLANAGHTPSAELALWMYLHGPALFDKDWDTTQDELTAWAQLARQPVPTQVARVYPQPLVSGAAHQR